MDETGLKVLRFVGQAPAMGMCTRCKQKFFVPREYLRDSQRAQELMGGKFMEHKRLKSHSKSTDK